MRWRAGAPSTAAGPASVVRCAVSVSSVTNAGVQYPHWSAEAALSHARTPVRAGAPERAVWMAAPWHCAARTRQDRTGRPSRRTVQTPHSPWSQPVLTGEPRAASSPASVSRGSVRRQWLAPSTWQVTSTRVPVRAPEPVRDMISPQKEPHRGLASRRIPSLRRRCSPAASDRTAASGRTAVPDRTNQQRFVGLFRHECSIPAVLIGQPAFTRLPENDASRPYE